MEGLKGKTERQRHPGGWIVSGYSHSIVLGGFEDMS